MNRFRFAPIPVTAPRWPDQLSHFFHFPQLHTNYRTEILAGITTFVTIAPFLVVNAQILSEGIFLHQPGDLFGQILAAIALTAAFSTALMGLVANYPFALVPGTGLIALFVFSIVLKMHMPWPLALSAVFVQGLLFTALSLSRFRHQLVHAIPTCIKHATIVGIGLFIAYVGMAGNPNPPALGAGLIVASETTKTTLGSLHQPATLMALLGLALIGGLTVRRVKGRIGNSSAGVGLEDCTRPSGNFFPPAMAFRSGWTGAGWVFQSHLAAGLEFCDRGLSAAVCCPVRLHWLSRGVGSAGSVDR
jgi:xanthine/uracil/vitamin C permease (AzgA family)